jgi:NADPH:quinone reductase-like Zn-dependent oxidoreductase
MVKAVCIKKVEGKPGKVYYPLEVREVEVPKTRDGEVLVRMTAAALNHRDLFIRQHLYPGTTFDVPLLADGCGVVESGILKGERVVLNPGHDWVADPVGPENQVYRALGGTKLNSLGTLQEIVSVHKDEIIRAPSHLSDAEVAALPLAGLTAWRALVTKSGNAEKGRNILIPGIGGGVAIFLLQFAVAMGCNVFVTSSSDDKLARAKELGAVAGVNYKKEKWENELQKLLPGDRPYLDAVIDGSGADIVQRSVKLLKAGGIVVSYGMTVMPQTVYPMTAVMKNIEIRGTMMGSRQEFFQMIKFVGKHKIKPIIHKTSHGIDHIAGLEQLFDEMKAGTQFGKLVVNISPSNQNKL